MLNIVDKKKDIDEYIVEEVINTLSSSDGFIVLSLKKGKLQWNRYQLDDTETLYLLEWAKIRLMSDAGI